MTHQELVESLDNDEVTYDFFQQEEKKPIIVDKLPKDCINLFDPVQCSYYNDNKVVLKALHELKKRRLDTAINRPRAFFVSLNDDFQKNRIVIPFYDEEDNVIFYQTRKLLEYDEEPTYKSKYCADKSVFGIDKVDPEMDCVFLFEGPFDSCFVKNGLAVAGISESKKFTMTETQKQQMNSLVFLDKIWVLDSQWLDETARKKSLHLLEMGEKVFIWPNKWGRRYKDFNQMCQDLGLDQISPTFIKDNTHEGSKGILKYKLMFRK